MNGRPWTAAEDAILSDARARHLSWSRCAALLPGRSSKSCASRWAHRDTVSMAPLPWTAAEDEILRVGCVEKMGWARMAALLPGRGLPAIRARLRRLGYVQPRPKPAVTRKPAEKSAILPFHDPKAAAIGCELLHAATMAFYARRLAA